MGIDAKNILVVYNGLSPEAKKLAAVLTQTLHIEFPARPADEPELALPHVPSLVITVGGDGTLLRATAIAAPLGVPLLGVNMGHLGFLTEIEGTEALEQIPKYLDEGFATIQERSMLQVEVQQSGDGFVHVTHALNDVAVGRGPMARLSHIRVMVDGVNLADYSCDAVVVSSATGSTGYSLSAGGPILHPNSPDMVLTSVAPHGDLGWAIVLPEDCIIDLMVESTEQTAISADGYWHMQLVEERTVRVSRSPHRAKFLRSGGPGRFYETLLYRLHRGPSPVPPGRTESDDHGIAR